MVALRALALDAEVALGGRWVKIQGESCAVFVVEISSREGYFVWCDAPAKRAVEVFPTPTDAIAAGLRRAACREEGTTDKGHTSESDIQRSTPKGSRT